MLGLAKAFLRDWCAELEDEVIDDHRPLLAGMSLMLEQTISSDQATWADDMRSLLRCHC